ncbi:hypothetical protein EDD22DRAFT_853212 [Suillus occidentalis]|nr:hypothetical protein EDD22DRAFT_853212 [Suillus occidentalis]
MSNMINIQWWLMIIMTHIQVTRRQNKAMVDALGNYRSWTVPTFTCHDTKARPNDSSVRGDGSKWSLFHRRNRRNGYALDSSSMAKETAHFCNLATRTLQNRIGNKLPTLPTTDTYLAFKWSRLRFLLDVALQYLLLTIKGLEAASNIYLHHADFGDTSARRWYI